MLIFVNNGLINKIYICLLTYLNYKGSNSIKKLVVLFSYFLIKKPKIIFLVTLRFEIEINKTFEVKKVLKKFRKRKLYRSFSQVYQY